MQKRKKGVTMAKRSALTELNEIRLQPERYFKEGQHIAVRNRAVGNFPLHWHNYFELEILSEGEAVNYLNGQPQEMSVGSGYILTPADYHIIVPKDPQQKIWHVPFDESIISPRHLQTIVSSGFSKTFHLDKETYERVEKLLSLLRHEYKHEGDNSCIRELFECLLCSIFRTMDSLPSAESQELIPNVTRGIIYLETHFRENPSLAEVATFAGFNPSYFSVLFSKVTGQSYTERLNSLRVSYAKKLLNSPISVAEVCYASGFGSLSNFHTVFQKLTGSSPSEYRKNLTFMIKKPQTT